MPVPVTPPTLHIPAIDLSPSSSQTDSERASILRSALATVGFLHVLNPSPSLTRSHVRDIFAAGSSLFDIPLSDKEAVGFDVDTGAGYTSMMGQTTGDKSKRLRGDLKESFSIGPNTAVSIPQSNAHSDPTIVNRLEEFREACFETGLRLLDLFTIALKTPDDDPAYFRGKHSYGNNESLRLIHYPAFPRASADEQGAQTKATGWEDLRIGDKDIRAGAHQDFGSATLLFQSPPGEDGTDTAVEGLEIFVVREDGDAEAPDGSGRKGWWVPTPKPEGVSEGGSILVNVGVSMEIWSGTQFRATWHRVVCPNPPDLEPGQVLPGRKSVVFFMIPNHDVLLTPIDASGRPAVAEGCISSGDFFKLRMARSYGKDEGAQPAPAMQAVR
ncbi:hypothetical protein EHS25_006117 [Saitozyma podzolica]|uniref:Fe2OG dioxygenase domain-containing protein n=1 Tax=Saitozyma podzolica TaxID=1890683 RepID=A0A427XTL9_9TREE|nr:hypothetical protein EHS25_006117 [Saitozyma podzolica]